VSAAAKAANWDARASPKAGVSRSGVATGRGMACVVYEGDNGYVAMVAEVEVDRASGRVRREAPHSSRRTAARVQSRRDAQTSSKAARSRA